MKDIFDQGLDPASFDAQFRVETDILAGADEAGRGPLAGPVVAAAVILAPDQEYPGLGDSKKLSLKARDQAFALIGERAVSWAWAALEAEEVDRLNPLRAALTAMCRAVAQLNPQPGLVLVDGNQRPNLPMRLSTVVKGDARSLSIGAASIVAKVVRDRLMLDWHQHYPQYGFDRHKGYGTVEHFLALKEHGPCPIHRLTFRGVRPALEKPARLFFDPAP